jgi:hypothetical protein
VLNYDDICHLSGNIHWQVRNIGEQDFAYNDSRCRVSPNFNVSVWDSFVLTEITVACVVYLKMLEEFVMVGLGCLHILTMRFEILGLQLSKETDSLANSFLWLWPLYFFFWGYKTMVLIITTAHQHVGTKCRDYIFTRHVYKCLVSAWIQI